MYLHIYHLDGTEEHIYCGDGSGIRTNGELLRLIGGDGAYMNRGTSQSWPLSSIRTYRKNESHNDKDYTPSWRSK